MMSIARLCFQAIATCACTIPVLLLSTLVLSVQAGEPSIAPRWYIVPPVATYAVESRIDPYGGSGTLYNHGRGVPYPGPWPYSSEEPTEGLTGTSFPAVYAWQESWEHEERQAVIAFYRIPASVFAGMGSDEVFLPGELWSFTQGSPVLSGGDLTQSNVRLGVFADPRAMEQAFSSIAPVEAGMPVDPQFYWDVYGQIGQFSTRYAIPRSYAQVDAETGDAWLGVWVDVVDTPLDQPPFWTSMRVGGLPLSAPTIAPNLSFRALGPEPTLEFADGPSGHEIGDRVVELFAQGRLVLTPDVAIPVTPAWRVNAPRTATFTTPLAAADHVAMQVDAVGPALFTATLGNDQGLQLSESIAVPTDAPSSGAIVMTLLDEQGVPVGATVAPGTPVTILVTYQGDFGSGSQAAQYSRIFLEFTDIVQEDGSSLPSINADIEVLPAYTMGSGGAINAQQGAQTGAEVGQAKFRFVNRYRLGLDRLVARNESGTVVSEPVSILWDVPVGAEIPAPPTEGGVAICPLPTGQITPLTSRVENPQLSHIHTATDFQPASGTAGCGSCGASGGAGGGLATDLRLDRIHRYADFTRPGSFGPGVFSNLDIQLTLWDHGASGEIWDPSAASPIPLTRISPGRYGDAKRSAIQSLLLYAADGATVVDADAAVTVVATQHDGSQWVFELVQAGLGGDADRQGRLTAIRDRVGNQLMVTYAFPADATDAVLGARSRLQEMATATDQRGRQLSFAYGWSCGQPVITTLTYPTGVTVTYHYDGDIAGVSAIDYPDGTHSSFTTHLDAASQTQVIDYQDAGAEGVHRTKSVHLTLVDWQNADGARIPQSPNRVRRVIGPTGEPTYLNWLERDGAQVQIYIFEGGGIAGKGRMLRLDTTEGVTDATWIAKSWSFATEPSTWAWEKVADYEADSRFRMGAQTEPLGKSTTYQRDPASGAITGREHRNASGSVVSRESTEYNAMRLPTRHQDANGLIARSTYDDQGNLRFRTEGIVLAEDGVTEDATHAVTSEWRYRADGQVLMEINPLGCVTEYEYDTRGFRTAEVSPPDDQSTPLVRARKEWHYDVAGRLEWSKDAAGHTTRYFYDDRNRAQEVRYGNESKELYQYGTGPNANLLLSKTDRDGMVTTFGYDAAGREITRVEGAQAPALAITTTTTYLEGTDLPQTVTRAGQKTEYVYDTRKRVVETRRWIDGSRYLADSTVFDAADRVAYTQDAFGRRTYSVYDDLDRVTRTLREAVPGGVPVGADVAALSRVLSDNPPYVIEETSYDVGGRVLTTTDAAGVVTKLGYDHLGRMIDRWEALGTPVEAHWQWTYDAVGNRETETDPLLHVTRFAYTGRNLLAAQTVAFGTADAATTRFSYTLTGQRSTQTDANDHTTQWIYGNCCDWLEDVIDAAGYVTHYTYTPGGLIETVRDASLHLTRTDNDGLKRPFAVTNGDNEITTTLYDDNLLDANGLSGTYAAEFARIADRTGHRAVAVLNHLMETTVQVSDGLGRTVLVIDAERHVTQTTYDQVVIAADGATLVETATTDPLGNTIRQRVDGLGRVREVIDAQQQVTTIRSDANGNRRGVTDPLGHSTSFTFDDRNRQTGSVDASGNTTSTEYDLLGNVLRQVDGFTHATEFTYTARNQKASETDRLGHTSTFSYDPAGNLIAISDAENEAKKATVTPEVYEAGKTRYTYTERNQLETERFPGETAARSYTYHPNGQLATRTDQRGIVTTYSYDGANRLTTRAYSDAPADAFVLDDAGRITTATSGRYGTVVERTWKPTGLIETETTTWPADISGVTSSALVQYGYDAANRGVSVTYPGGASLARTFTARNQLDTLTLGTQLMATAGHDDAGRRTSLLYGNGLTDTRTYTDDNRLESTVVSAAAPAAPALSLSYQYDANRRKTDETDALTATRNQHFAYDDADRLTSWNTGSATQAWTLSAVGDWKNTTVNGVIENRDHTAVHEIAKINDIPVLHDAAGNLARAAQGQGFSWDAENRLLMADIAPNNEKTQGQAFYWYDALGRRVAKRVHDSVTRYVHDGWQVIQELDAPYVATPAEAASDGALTNLATVPDGALLYPTYDAEGNRHDPVRVNFQPETTAIPDGFISDKGRAFDVRTNGLSYGWDTAHTDAQVRHFHPLPQYDTMGHLDGGSWRIALPNGTYPVAIVAGDATSLAHTNNLVVNGQALTDPDPGDDSTVPAYQKGDFDGWLVNVEVTEGFLTIQAGDGAFDPTLTHVEIGAMGQPITSEMQQRLADQILAATQRTGGSPFWNGGRTEARNYVWDPSYVDALVAYQRTTESGTESFYVHSGAQYSVQAVADSSGNVVERYSYDAYGTRAIEGVSNGGRSVIGLTTGFTGRELDEETGLYYFRNRMYSASAGRFVSRDPMGYVDGMSLYRGYFVPGAMDSEGTFTHTETDNIWEGGPIGPDIIAFAAMGRIRLSKVFVDADSVGGFGGTPLETTLTTAIPVGVSTKFLGKMRDATYLGSGFVIDYIPMVPGACPPYKRLFWKQLVLNPFYLPDWGDFGYSTPWVAYDPYATPPVHSKVADFPGTTFSGLFNRDFTQKFLLMLEGEDFTGGRRVVWSTRWSSHVNVVSKGSPHTLFKGTVTLTIPGWP